jgi:RimJ/RimL family protein N-acetyltransferase
LRDGDGLVLRPMTEADLGPLADLLPLDVEMDPSLPAFAVEDPRVARGIAQAQEYWRRLGTWRRESWNLPFVVVRDGALLGVQSLEAEGFAERRTVDSSSWLATQARGRGIGKAMRRAVLALAFDGLAAEFAETSAWSDNAASLGVSRSLGYVDNGVHRQASPGRVDDMVHLRMTRKTWLARHTDHGVHIEGLSGCQQFFS